MGREGGGEEGRRRERVGGEGGKKGGTEGEEEREGIEPCRYTHNRHVGCTIMVRQDAM